MTKHKNVLYYNEPDEAFDFLKDNLKEGDLFITMGAGDNWKLCVKIFDYFKQRELEDR
jgi:UDP-N-acetylmuramate--alanine ligase